MNLRNCLLLLSFFSFPFARATTPPVNDECTGAINVVINADVISSSIAGATLSMPACTDTAYSDIWFKFTATSTLLQLYAYGADALPVVVQVFSGSCGNLTSIDCYFHANGYADLANLTVGATYYYRVYLKGGNKAQTSIETGISSHPAPPSNDEVTGAIALYTDSTYTLAMGFATPSMPPCNNIQNEADDQWYKFVAKTTVNYITLTPILQSTDYVFQVFSGTPGNLTSLGCFNNPVATNSDEAILTTLTVGQTYYIRVYNNNGNTGSAYQFKLNITGIPIPVNDECTGAINVPTTGTVVNSSLAGATLSMPACADTAYNDIWFWFTAAGTRQQIHAQASGILPPKPTIIQVFSGTCGNLTPIACNSYLDDVADVSGLNLHETYFYRIYIDGNKNSQSAVTTSIVTPGAPPSNDEATGAIAIVENQLYSDLNLGYATQSMPPCNNTSNQAEDTWYKFVASNTSANIAVNQYQNPVDLTFQVFSGTPTNLTSLVCHSNGNAAPTDSITVRNLVAGQTYYIRVYNNIGVASPSIQFNLEVTSAILVSRPLTETANKGYTVYPNPAKDYIYVNNSDGKSGSEYAIADMTGRVLLSGKLSGNQINIGKLLTGSYVLTIKDAVKPLSILFIKE